MMHFFPSIFICLLFVSAASADVIRTDVEPALSIAPDETKVIVIESKYGKPVELFWQTLSPESCKNSACVKFKEKNASFDFASFNGQGTYDATDNKVTLSFTNQTKTPVTLQLTKIERTCTAEICDLILTTDTQDWKVVRIQEFIEIKNSEDGSYSILQGVTTKGKKFEIILAWWFYEASSYSTSCPKFIQRWINKPNRDYVPYVIAGSSLVPNIKNKKQFILSVDTCTKKAVNFNAPKDSEY